MRVRFHQVDADTAMQQQFNLHSAAAFCSKWQWKCSPCGFTLPYAVCLRSQSSGKPERCLWRRLTEWASQTDPGLNSSTKPHTVWVKPRTHSWFKAGSRYCYIKKRGHIYVYCYTIFKCHSWWTHIELLHGFVDYSVLFSVQLWHYLRSRTLTPAMDTALI